MIQTLRSVARLSALMLAFVASGCGGDDDPTGPQANPDFMVGEWIAESMVLTSKANPEIAPDIIQPPGNATFTLSVQPSGRYTAILAGWGQSSSESGVLTVEGSDVVFMRRLPSPEESRAQWERAASSVILSGDTDFDFNLDGMSEPATLRLVLVPR